MENNKGLKKVLCCSLIYKILMNLLGAKGAAHWIATNFFKIEPGYKIIDIGCGPGSFWENYTNLIPQEIDYHGIDPHEEYIKTANKKFNRKGSFHLGTTTTYLEDNLFKNSDIVMCSGVLHHLNNTEVIELFKFAVNNLKIKGRFLSIEPVHLLKESFLANWFMNQDRGLHIRNEDEWKELLKMSKMTFKTNIINGLIRIPYNYIFIEAIND